MRIFSKDHLNSFTKSKRFFVYTSLALLGIAILSIGSIDTNIPVGFGYLGNEGNYHNLDNHHNEGNYHNLDNHHNEGNHHNLDNHHNEGNYHNEGNHHNLDNHH